MRRFLIVLLALLSVPAGAVELSDPQSLVEAALERHPALARVRAEAAAARERIAPAGALPNPMLMAGVRDKLTDFSDDEMMTMIMVGASQTLTRGRKRDARRALATIEAEAVEKELASLRAEIERDVLLAWYDLAAADAQLRATEEVREMVAAVVASARVRYEIGTSAQSDVIRAQLQEGDLDREMIRLRGARRAALASLLPLLGLPVDTVVPPLTFPAGEIPAESTPDAPPAGHPALAALQSQIERAEAQVRVARLDAKPDVDLEAQYGYREMQRDTFSITARVELPIRRDQTIEARVREAMNRREAARSGIEELRQALIQDMAAAAAARDEAGEQRRLLEAVLVPQARLAFESTLAAYQSGGAPFDAVLSSQIAYLRLRLQSFELASRQAQAAATHEALRKGARSGSTAFSAPLPGSGGSQPSPSMNAMQE